MTVTKQLVKSILEKATAYTWSLQGLGMLRLYLSTEIRLHVWDSRFAVAFVSTVHDHPWDLKSTIIAGRLNNYRFVETSEQNGLPFFRATLQCGPGGCMKSPPEPVRLHRMICERYFAGNSYSQKHDEIHESQPEDGTVTIVVRSFKQDTEHARVYWPKGNEWVSAEPRPATEKEVIDITRASLARWFAQ